MKNGGGGLKEDMRSVVYNKGEVKRGLDMFAR